MVIFISCLVLSVTYIYICLFLLFFPYLGFSVLTDGGGGHGHSHGGGGGHGHGHSHGGSAKNNHSHGHHHLSPDGDVSSREASPQPLTPTPDSEADTTSEKSTKPVAAPSAASQMNMKGVFLHVLADALGSVIVCISACVIIFTDFEYKEYVDPTLSVLMVTLIIYSTWGLLVESAMILLQTVPTHIQIDSLQRKLLQEVSELFLLLKGKCLCSPCDYFSCETHCGVHQIVISGSHGVVILWEGICVSRDQLSCL